MDNLVIEQTYSTPYVCFDATTGVFQIKGESFPENVAKFYAPVMAWLREYLSTNQELVMEFEVIYFNSSTSKVFMTIFDLLETEAKSGKQVSVRWRCNKENETAIECGGEFKEDLEVLPFYIEIF